MGDGKQPRSCILFVPEVVFPVFDVNGRRGWVSSTLVGSMIVERGLKERRSRA